MNKRAPEEGSIIRGLMVEVIYDEGITRPRIRPVAGSEAPTWMRVEFPTELRDNRQEGAMFRIDATVSQKHNRDGSERGQPYLRAHRPSIQVL
jgi:hypothetical protein